MIFVRGFGFRLRGYDETWCASWTRRMAAEGTRSDGFKMYELPGDALARGLEGGGGGGRWADREGYDKIMQGCGFVRGEFERGWPAMRPTGNIHRGIMAGKVKGAMPAQTPRGTLYEYVSMPLDTFSSVSPIRWLAAPHVVSTTSRPLKRRQDWNECRRQRQEEEEEEEQKKEEEQEEEEGAAPEHVAAGVCESLALLARDDGRQLFLVLADEGLVPKTAGVK